jgi:hypothetical protein
MEFSEGKKKGKEQQKYWYDIFSSTANNIDAILIMTFNRES